MELESLIHTLSELYIDTFFIDELTQRDYDIINLSLFDYHNSYYFNNSFKHIELARDLADNSIILKDNQKKATYDSNPITRDDRNYNNNKPITRTDFSDLSNDLSFFKEALNESSKLFSLIFEENEIKKVINLKNRNEIMFTEIEVSNSERDLNKILAKFHLVDRDYTTSNLIENYGFNYLKNIGNDMPTRLYIAHNNYEIAGIMQLGDSLFIDDLDYLYKDKFKYIKSVEVSSLFRGQNIGIQLYMKALERNEENREILINSRYTKEGSLYLENKVIALTKNYKGVFILENEKQNYAYDAIEEIFKKDQNYNDCFIKFNSLLIEERYKINNPSPLKTSIKKNTF